MAKYSLQKEQEILGQRTKQNNLGIKPSSSIVLSRMSTLSRLLPTQRLLLFSSPPTSNSHITLAHREKRSQNMAPTTLAASAYRQFHAVVVKAGYMQKTVTARIGDQMFSRRLGKVRFQFILSPHIPPSPSLALPPSFAYCFN